GDDLLLDPLALGVELVEFGEELLALVLEGRPCLREAAPQLLIDRARQARTVALHILPLCEQLTQTRARLLPLDLRRILLGLGLGDELLTVLGRGELRGLRTGGLPGLRGLGIGDESVEGRAEVLEITDDIGLRKRLLQGRGG